MHIKRCEVCGSNLSQDGNHFHCPYCGADYDEVSANEVLEKLSNILDDAKQEVLANARRMLYDAVHRENPRRIGIMDAASRVLAIYPEDRMASFYRDSLDDDPTVVNEFLRSAKLDPFSAKAVVEWMLPGMGIKNVNALLYFIEQNFEGDDRLLYVSRVEKEMAALEGGLYDLSLERDVFLAYSSKDMAEVVRLVDYLESNGLTVFVAYRNLRHGLGAAKKDNYKEAILEAIDHARTFVFVSTKNSRDLSCDAVDFEIPYVKSYRPDMGRIEYVIKEPGANEAKAALLKIKALFDGLEWCRDEEDLLRRVVSFHDHAPIRCPNCGKANAHDARHCVACGASLIEEKKADSVTSSVPQKVDKKLPFILLICMIAITAFGFVLFFTVKTYGRIFLIVAGAFDILLGIAYFISSKKRGGDHGHR